MIESRRPTRGWKAMLHRWPLLAVLATQLVFGAVNATAAQPAQAGATTPATAVAPARDTSVRSRLPISEGMPQVRLPRPRQVTLDNGLRLLVLEKSSQLPIFSLKLVVRGAGGLYEPADRRGLAGFVAKMLRQGTSTRSAQDVSRQLETLGVTLDADAPLGAVDATISVTGLATHLDATLDLLADTLRNPAFADDEVARYASNTLAELPVRRARPELLSQEQLLQAVYGDHPAAAALPSAESIKATTAAELRRFHADHYRPNAAVLVVAGDVTLDTVLPKARRVFDAWQSRQASPARLPAIPSPRGRGVHLVDRPGAVQTVLQVGVIGITRTDADYLPLLVMNEVLGGQSSSRLFQNLREKNGYTYGAYSGFNAIAIPGLWQIMTTVRTEVTGLAMKELLAEMQRIRNEPVTPVELANAKRALVGKYIFSLERPASLLDNAVTQELYGLPAQYWDTYATKVNEVSAADVQRVANRIIDLEHLQIGAAGDGAKVRPMLADYTPRAKDAGDPAEPSPASPPKGPDSASATGAAGFDFSAEEHAHMRHTIAQIADRLIVRAEQEGVGWTGADSKSEPQDVFNFYNGAPGAYYFLLKAHRALGERRYLQMAKRGMDRLLAQAHADDHGRYFHATLNGVFEGNAGPGYLFLYAHHMTGERRYLDVAESVARHIVAVPDVQPASLPDIIAGAAGTGLFLLRMHEVTGDPLYLEGAKRLGDFLIEHAEARGAGVTWKLTANGHDYYFVGFAHGPAGIAYYLDQLHAATAQQRYKTYADRALAHIDAIAVTEAGASQDQSMLKWYHEQLQRSTLFPSQWCHGAPGMNPFFMQRHAHGADQRSLDRALGNTRYLLKQGVDVRGNPSVCHGVAGNAASLVVMYQATGDAQYWKEIRHSVDLLDDYVGKRIEQQPGSASAVNQDYSYMTGLAGIGDFLVLLYSEGKLGMFGPLGYGNDLVAAGSIKTSE